MQYPIHITLRAQGPGVHVLELDVEAHTYYEALVFALDRLEQMPWAVCEIAEGRRVCQH